MSDARVNARSYLYEEACEGTRLQIHDAGFGNGVSQRLMLGHSLQQASAASNSTCGASHSKEPSSA
jgi:hypothetical protein